jgi:hypothetical protein
LEIAVGDTNVTSSNATSSNATSTNTCILRFSRNKIATRDGYLHLGEVELYGTTGALIPSASLTTTIIYPYIEDSNGPSICCVDGQ